MTWPKKTYLPTYLCTFIREHHKGIILGTCDICDTDYNSDNWEHEFMTIFVTWKLRVSVDSICNSCDVFSVTLYFMFRICEGGDRKGCGRWTSCCFISHFHIPSPPFSRKTSLKPALHHFRQLFEGLVNTNLMEHESKKSRLQQMQCTPLCFRNSYCHKQKIPCKALFVQIFSFCKK